MPSRAKRKIVVLGTGGTIAGRSASSGLGYQAAQISVQTLVAGLPGLDGLVGGADSLVVEQIAQIDSKDMSFAIWEQMARRLQTWLVCEDVQGVVITHGTDTLEETAYFLQTLLAPTKPVVLTCAMRPATALLSDGPQNLLDAFTVAVHPQARGVLVVCAGTVHGAQHVQKVHTYRLDAFESGDAGPLGHVVEGHFHLLNTCPQAVEFSSHIAINCEAVLRAPVWIWPWVEIVSSHAGADARAVTALLAQGVDGLVVAATGNATVHSSLEGALLAAQAAGVPVLRASRCLRGGVAVDAQAPLPVFPEASPAKARIALLLHLMSLALACQPMPLKTG